MLLFIKDLSGKHLQIEVPNSSVTINELKLKIGEAWDIEPSHQRLTFAGKRLESWSKLSDYNIQKESTLHLAQHLRTRSDRTLVVRFPGGQLVSVHASNDASGGDLKANIQFTCGVELTSQRLLWGDVVLRARDSIKSLAGSEHSILDLEIISTRPYSISIEGENELMINLQVLYSDLGSWVRDLIERQTGIPVWRQQLWHRGEIIGDRDVLADCLIDPGSTIRLIQLPVDEEVHNIDVILQFNNSGPRDLFCIKRTDFVSSLKAKISEAFSIPGANLVIRTQKKPQLVLEDTRALETYEIVTGSVLEVDLPDEKLIVVHLRGPTGSLIPGLILKASSTIAGLKQVVAAGKYHAVPENATMFDVMLSGGLLKDNLTLESYNINKCTKLDLQIKELPLFDGTTLDDLPKGYLNQTVQHQSEPLVARRGLHLLLDKSMQLQSGRWKSLREELPELLRWDIEYAQGVWTVTPTSMIPPDSLPFTIAGAPVILPVDYRYPLMGPVAPPPDPHPSFIDPSAPLAIKTIALIFKEFSDAIGFYILLNRMLQIIVPAPFDYEWASSHKPNVFGGLKICYIPQSVTATASKPTVSKAITSPENIIPSVPTLDEYQTSFKRASVFIPVPRSKLDIDHIIEARVKDGKARQKHSGKIGVKTRYKDKTYLTMSSHVITSALLAEKEREPFYRKWLNSTQVQLSSDWVKNAEVFAHNVKIGNIAETFDPEAQDYPTGFQYDISLIEPVDEKYVAAVKSPIVQLGWLSQEGWNSLRQSPYKLLVLDGQVSEAKVIPSFGPSQCLVVGEGIFLNRNKLFASESKKLLQHGLRGQEQEEELKIWTNLVSRALLYRVFPDFGVPGGQSGLALYAEGAREDKTVGPGVAGFQSFVQRSGHVQTYEIEGKDLDTRLRKGLVAFYGTFQVPEVMRKEHVIL